MPLSRTALIKRAQSIQLIAMDVDGVLTDGGIISLDSGEEVKKWNAKDRLALSLLRESDISLPLAWITGRSSESVLRSAKELGVHHVVQKCKNKSKALADILEEHHLGFHQAAFIGDDLIDLPAMRKVGFGACPADAVADIRKYTHYISPYSGGQGVVRDILEFILRAQKKWDLLLDPFLG